jgi:hypothetical protein
VGLKITMSKEPNKLAAARAELERAEVDLTDPGRLSDLRNAINSLLELLSGASPRIEKDIAKKLLLRSRNKVLSEAKAVLANYESYEPRYLEHWNSVMEVFVDPNLADDPEFNACKEQLLTGCVNQYAVTFPAPAVSLGNSPPPHVDFPEKKEAQATSPQNDFYFRKNSKARTMLYAESLRAIGQSLEMLRLPTFEIEKIGDFCIVRSELLTETHEWILKNNLAAQILDSPLSEQETTEFTVGDGWLCYGPLDIARLNAREIKKRDSHVSDFRQTGTADKLSQLLAVLGELLDSKKATAFKITWASDSVSVQYEIPNGVSERKDLTVEKLQQLALGSKFRRSSSNSLIASR